MVVQGPAGPGNYNTAGKRRQSIAVGSTRSICGDGSGVEFQLVGSIVRANQRGPDGDMECLSARVPC
ncbi:hypothetical protein PABG_07418 [Paracoccidioides brasiliensis Pb03]|nr:hypothetical protein PABG_07418 [Paracoccidioides brasiliensis Pb03]